MQPNTKKNVNMQRMLMIAMYVTTVAYAAAPPNTFNNKRTEVVFSNDAMKLALAPLTHEHKYYVSVPQLTFSNQPPILLTSNNLVQNKVVTTSTMWGGSRTTWTIYVQMDRANATMVCTIPGVQSYAVSCNATVITTNRTMTSASLWVDMWSRQRDFIHVTQELDSVVLLMQREDASHSATLVINDNNGGNTLINADRGRASVSQTFSHHGPYSIVFHMAITAVTMEEIIANIVYFVVCGMIILVFVVLANTTFSRCSSWCMRDDITHTSRNILIDNTLMP